MQKIATSSLDDFDRAILRIVQKNNQLTHEKLAQEIGLSGSAVRRRLTRLRKDGIIKRDIAIVEPKELSVTLVVQITFEVDTPEAYSALDTLIDADPHIKQGYHVSGPVDYILVVQGPTLQWYEQWAKETLMRDNSIRRHDTSVVYSCKKFDTSVEV
jgi:Lrp/AsnC family leucine-responsive transcriptional regulator